MDKTCCHGYHECKVCPTLTLAQLHKALSHEFSIIETRVQRVGSVFLHPRDIATLRTNRDCWDDAVSRFGSRKLWDEAPGVDDLGTRVGYWWSAPVYVSDVVPRGHCCVLPEGVRGKPVSERGCIDLFKSPALRYGTRRIDYLVDEARLEARELTAREIESLKPLKL